MAPDLTDTLCTRCGLCCDGTLFADVELSGRAEATRVALLGLEVEDDGGDRELLVQPCVALRGTRCGIYPHRPNCCRSFECRLLLETRRGTVGVEQARARIAATLGHARRVRALLRRLGGPDAGLPLGEAVAEALAGSTGPDPRTPAWRAALRAAMRSLERAIRRDFLRDDPSGAGRA